MVPEVTLHGSQGTDAWQRRLRICMAIRVAKCNTHSYAVRMAQLVTRVGDDLAAAVDRLVEAGIVASRSEAVRLALEQLVDRCRREEIGARIRRGYLDRPQDEADLAWADESTVRMITEEPW
ncbi:MAG TPA: ribbon-helix-helix protein, CopG family [Acidimicrobiales bacterium]|nr:ribbon-helix-helix protein, CopG family [Acidimicrobiales bacterium]